MNTFTQTPNSTALAALDMSGFGDDNAEVVQPTLEENPSLRWMTGNLSTTDRKVAVGWHVRSGVNPVLDRRLTAMGVEHYVVQHETGEERLIPYWNLSWAGHTVSLIIVAYGVKSPWEMKRDLNDRAGVAYGTGTVRDREGNVVYREGTDQPKLRPQLQLRAFVHEVLGTNEHPDEGFNNWFKVSVSNYTVDELFRVLNAQYRVIDAFNAIMVAQGKATRAAYWGFSIPTVISEEGKMVGRDKDHQSMIYPMVPLVPSLSVDAGHIGNTVAYLNTHRIPQHIQECLLAGGLLDETVVWSIEHSHEIVNGKQEEGVITTVTEVGEEEPLHPHPTAVALPQLPSGDPLVTAEQAAWVRDTYCGNQQQTITAVCKHFHIEALTQLRVGQYNALYQQVNP